MDESIQFSDLEHLPGNFDKQVKWFICSKDKINWEQEINEVRRFPELEFLHKSETFIQPCHCQSEYWHRYCIGKQIFLNKSLKCHIWGKYMKISFKRKSFLKIWCLVSAPYFACFNIWIIEKCYLFTDTAGTAVRLGDFDILIGFKRISDWIECSFNNTSALDLFFHNV